MGDGRLTYEFTSSPIVNFSKTLRDNVKSTRRVNV